MVFLFVVNVIGNPALQTTPTRVIVPSSIQTPSPAAPKCKIMFKCTIDFLSYISVLAYSFACRYDDGFFIFPVQIRPTSSPGTQNLQIIQGPSGQLQVRGLMQGMHRPHSQYR